MNKREQANKESRIAHIIDTLSIDMDARGTFACVRSESGNGSYRVNIDESGSTPRATSCQCVGHMDFGKYCQHMIGVDRFFARIYAREEVNPRTGMTDREWQWYRNYELSIGVAC